MNRVSPDPYQNLAVLRDRITRLLESTVARSGDTDWEQSPQWSPLVDVYETDGEVVLVAEVPGLSMDDLEVQVSDESVTLKGSRPAFADDGEMKPQRLERAQGDFSRTFHLNTTVDRDRVTAEYRLGLLRVVLPKKRKSEPRSIKVSKR